MTRTMRVTAIALAALVGGAIGVMAAPAAHASDVPLHFDLGVVLPGASATTSQPVDVPRDATVASTTWLDQTGSQDVVWTTALCGKAIGCIPMPDLTGTFLPAGTYELAVSVALPDSPTEENLSASADGAVTFVEASPVLAATGGEWPWPAAMMGAVMCALGAFLLIRRRTERAR